MKCNYCGQDRSHLVSVHYDDVGTKEIRALCLLCIFKRGKQMFDDLKWRDEMRYKYELRESEEYRPD